MCTVTFLPIDYNSFVLTNNRDEAPDRDTIRPTIQSINNIDVLCPIDKRAGGTWIGLSGKDRLVCLLNGGFTFHERRANYRKSRGVVVKDLLVSNSILDDLKSYDYTDIEPFTLIVIEYHTNLELYELVWDGEIAHFRALPLAPLIWSSSSLYNDAMKHQRQQWFNSFLSEKNITPESILSFHHNAGSDNEDYGVIMNRHFVRTTSISQIVKHQDQLTWHYEDLQTKAVSHFKFDIEHQIND